MRNLALVAAFSIGITSPATQTASQLSISNDFGRLFDCSRVPQPMQPNSWNEADRAPFAAILANETRFGRAYDSAIVYVEFDEAGKVRKVGINKTSANRAIDSAAFNWAKCIRTQPGAIQWMTIPLDFK